MDFDDTPEEAAYRAKARAWLDVNAPMGVQQRRAREVETAETLVVAKAWQARKAEAGYACIPWSSDWGGPGGTPIQSVIFAQEEAKHSIPGNPFAIGLGMCVPTVATFADDAARKRFVGPAMRGDEIWCQLFSEPAGGSDVAAVRTRAERAPDGSGDWIVNGQKVWTTGAQFSDFGIVLCRTDPDAPKHKGMTMFWLDMKSPGVEVRPIHQMAGAAGFNEVFFTDVRIPDAQRLGPIGDGWKVSLFTLMNERMAIGGESGAGWADFMDLARQTPGLKGTSALADQAVREKLADWYVKSEGLKHTRNRTITALSRGQTPGPENSIGKLVSATMMQDLAHAAVEMLDEYGIVADGAATGANPIFHNSLMGAPGMRIAGGTDEILRNIVAERVLGLPGDIRLDKGVAFKDIPTGR